ncbi:unnamed protein product [Sphenostylis stenocarpa]|uniref:Amidohydrolase 3 domain-containing protein n=1 Tax=Sphenostylis stenocarpa TaxID=92480 RepID=A0AA87B8E4_9FABA|nr:unnamed protein product [Sphenostylis stenocarpa]
MEKDFLLHGFVNEVCDIFVVNSFTIPDFWPWKSQLSHHPVADLVLRNGVIYTSDDSLPFAESLAVANGRVLRVGNHSFVKELEGYGTQVLDLGGKVVVPGFIDSHVHFIAGGLQVKCMSQFSDCFFCPISYYVPEVVCLPSFSEMIIWDRLKQQMMQVELRGVHKKEEFIRMIKDAAQSSKQGSWILGGGWNNDQWGGDLPVASWIDDTTPNNPVWLSRVDGHMGLGNSVALKLAGITNLTDDPIGGIIVRAANGEPTGVLIDSAMTLITSLIPEDSVDDRREALLRASSLALTRGVTTVVDMGRYYPGFSAELSWDDFSVGHALSEWIYIGGVKAFADGSLGSNSALLYEPYVDEPENYGLQVTEPEALLNMTLESDLNGLQVAIHAIGDKTNDLILDMYSSVASTNGMRDRRFRIEHAQQLAAGTPGRFGKQRVVASMQPDQLLDDADSTSRKLGKDRADTESYLFRSLLNNNALVAFGSDWPVVDINPLSGIKTAMTRTPPTWESAWIPSECISLDDAIKAWTEDKFLSPHADLNLVGKTILVYTISAARASFLDKDLGSLCPGKLADFVILSTDSWQDFAEDASASIEETYVSGYELTFKELVPNPKYYETPKEKLDRGDLDELA